mmetsp:Transcript_50106/g.160311  ORF Transcript_50106/g.160311 Transcript_50106/m.160311 type:complete len:298 (-) Transcript_50106:1281-2174(-)
MVRMQRRPYHGPKSLLNSCACRWMQLLILPTSRGSREHSALCTSAAATQVQGPSACSWARMPSGWFRCGSVLTILRASSPPIGSLRCLRRRAVQGRLAQGLPILGQLGVASLHHSRGSSSDYTAPMLQDSACPRGKMRRGSFGLLPQGLHRTAARRALHPSRPEVLPVKQQRTSAQSADLQQRTVSQRRRSRTLLCVRCSGVYHQGRSELACSFPEVWTQGCLHGSVHVVMSGQVADARATRWDFRTLPGRRIPRTCPQLERQLPPCRSSGDGSWWGLGRQRACSKTPLRLWPTGIR